MAKFFGGKMQIFIKDNIVIDTIDDQIVITKKNKNNEIDISNAIVLDDVAKFIFENIQSGLTENDILERIISQYDIDKEVAEKDLTNFIKQLEEEKIVYVK